jgi:hypothetical protein
MFNALKQQLINRLNITWRIKSFLYIENFFIVCENCTQCSDQWFLVSSVNLSNTVCFNTSLETVQQLYLVE